MGLEYPVLADWVVEGSLNTLRRSDQSVSVETSLVEALTIVLVEVECAGNSRKP